MSQHPGQESSGFPQTLQQLQASWDLLHALQQLHELSFLDPPQLWQTHSHWTFLQVSQHPGQESSGLPQTLQQLQASWGLLHALQQLHELSILDPPQLRQQVQALCSSRDSLSRQVLQRCSVPGHLQFLMRHLQTWHLVIIGCS